ncbi:ABC transporter ATP-binding protein [Dongia sp.]|uniref:ABC transporter ATP-binding protein n=1 Tax=Dongia sp. TaxID=1977262 RepID=UPI0035B41937
MSALLTLANVTAGYGSQPVLHDVSLTIAEGGVTAIIGPNGHGKTTLLRAISGLLPLRSGRISLGGLALNDLRADEIVDAGIVHVPQGDMLFPEMTVLENLLMGAYLPAAAAESGRRLEQVFALLPKLRDRRGQVASTLSGGERRMVGIGRGLMGGGRLLMLDEPSLGLAPIVIDQIYEVIGELTAAGHSILVVEENAARVSDKAVLIALLDNGQLVWSGQGAELMARPEILETYLGA